jgi:hypothetical protein
VNRLVLQIAPVGASIAFYESNLILSRGRDKTDNMDFNPTEKQLDGELKLLSELLRQNHVP